MDKKAAKLMMEKRKPKEIEYKCGKCGSEKGSVFPDMVDWYLIFTCKKCGKETNVHDMSHDEASNTFNNIFGF